MWQLIAAGVALGVIFYIYSKNSGGGETEPEYGYLSGTEGGEPLLTGGASGGGETAAPTTGGGIAETLGILEALRNAGLIPEAGSAGPEREEIVTEKEGPEPKTNAEVAKAQLATRAARKAEHKLTNELNKAKAAAKKLEHKHTQKHNSTGGSAHTPHTHHAKAHPAAKVGAAKTANKHRSDTNRGHATNKKKRR